MRKKKWVKKFGLKKYVGSKKILGQKIFVGQKNLSQFGSKFFLSQIIFFNLKKIGLKKIWVKRKFGSKKHFWVKKIFWVRKILSEKVFLMKTNFG